ncbi:hypothetical protein LCGC14_0854550 [marine sediment metagenome]|uniref:Uncharacterized protein n=1 Tax=marine sediment metagenome TaxID=412755 RepID=A0A0F9P9A3_9ZZZZ
MIAPLSDTGCAGRGAGPGLGPPGGGGALAGPPGGGGALAGPPGGGGALAGPPGGLPGGPLGAAEAATATGLAFNVETS